MPPTASNITGRNILEGPPPPDAPQFDERRGGRPLMAREMAVPTVRCSARLCEKAGEPPNRGAECRRGVAPPSIKTEEVRHGVFGSKGSYSAQQIEGPPLQTSGRRSRNSVRRPTERTPRRTQGQALAKFGHTWSTSGNYNGLRFGQPTTLPHQTSMARKAHAAASLGGLWG